MKISRRLLSILSIVAGLFVLAGLTAAQQSPRGTTPEDYFSFEFISDPQISPDGKLVAYVVTKVDRAQNRRNSAIWMTATDGSRTPWQFTTAPQSSTSPADGAVMNLQFRQSLAAVNMKVWNDRVAFDRRRIVSRHG